MQTRMGILLWQPLQRWQPFLAHALAHPMANAQAQRNAVSQHLPTVFVVLVFHVGDCVTCIWAWHEWLCRNKKLTMVKIWRLSTRREGKPGIIWLWRRGLTPR